VIGWVIRITSTVYDIQSCTQQEIFPVSFLPIGYRLERGRNRAPTPRLWRICRSVPSGSVKRTETHCETRIFADSGLPRGSV